MPCIWRDPGPGAPTTRGLGPGPVPASSRGNCRPMRHGQGSSQGRTTDTTAKGEENQAGWSLTRFHVYRHGACSYAHAGTPGPRPQAGQLPGGADHPWPPVTWAQLPGGADYPPGKSGVMKRPPPPAPPLGAACRFSCTICPLHTHHLTGVHFQAPGHIPHTSRRRIAVYTAGLMCAI